MNRTGILIVTYNSADTIERCLESCGNLPVVVVDNASQDETCDLVRRRDAVTLIANSTNSGFAGAVNQGVPALDAELVLLLNPDAELKTPIGALEDACLTEGAGLASGQLVDECGRPQRGFALRRLPKLETLAFEVLGINRLIAWNPVNRSYRGLDLDLSREQEAEQPPGAFLMFRRDVWQRLGGFDTQFYPLWFEDVDFCKRARDLGVRIQYVPRAIAMHRGGHSIAGLDWECREAYWYVSLLKYASKHFGSRPFRWVSAAVVLGSLFRTAIGVMTRRSLRPLTVYGTIGQLAGRSLISGRVGKLNFSRLKQGSRETVAVKYFEE